GAPRNAASAGWAAVIRRFANIGWYVALIACLLSEVATAAKAAIRLLRQHLTAHGVGQIGVGFRTFAGTRSSDKIAPLAAIRQSLSTGRRPRPFSVGRKDGNHPVLSVTVSSMIAAMSCRRKLPGVPVCWIKL